MSDAIQIHILDKPVQAYLQTYPFGFGLEPDMNQAALASLRQGLRVRPPAQSPEVFPADPSKPTLGPEEVQSVKVWLERLGVPDDLRRWAWEGLAWKIARIPRTARSVLSIGCGGGIELILIRALLPEAKIIGVDFQDSVSEPTKTALGLRFSQGHFNDFLLGNEQRFDAVFCNHVLEHLYDPETTLRLVRSRLKPGGCLIAGLPMEGHEDGVFANAMHRMASNPQALHPLDVGVLDAGHAWKTNPPDLRETLYNQGFANVELYLRSKKETTVMTVKRKVGIVLYSCSFGLWRRLLKTFFPEQAPYWVARGLLAAERRCWFGANRLKNQFAKEVLVVAFVAPPPKEKETTCQ